MDVVWALCNHPTTGWRTPPKLPPISSLGLQFNPGPAPPHQNPHPFIFSILFLKRKNELFPPPCYQTRPRWSNSPGGSLSPNSAHTPHMIPLCVFHFGFLALFFAIFLTFGWQNAFFAVLSTAKWLFRRFADCEWIFCRFANGEAAFSLFRRKANLKQIGF